MKSDKHSFEQLLGEDFLIIAFEYVLGRRVTAVLSGLETIKLDWLRRDDAAQRKSLCYMIADDALIAFSNCKAKIDRIN